MPPSRRQRKLAFPSEIFGLDTPSVARALLGMLLVRTTPRGVLVVRIVETEAYLCDDPACHGVRRLRDGTTAPRRTARTEPMFGPPGRAYVYFTYGNHWCFNIVAARRGIGEGVLIRAAEPLEGLEIMADLRGRSSPRELASGPGKLAQALAIDGSFNGHDLRKEPLRLARGEPVPPGRIVVARRVGIALAADKLLRFYEKGSPFVSRR